MESERRCCSGGVLIQRVRTIGTIPANWPRIKIRKFAMVPNDWPRSVVSLFTFDEPRANHLVLRNDWPSPYRFFVDSFVPGPIVAAYRPIGPGVCFHLSLLTNPRPIILSSETIGPVLTGFLWILLFQGQSLQPTGRLVQEYVFTFHF